MFVKFHHALISVCSIAGIVCYFINIPIAVIACGIFIFLSSISYGLKEFIMNLSIIVSFIILALIFDFEILEFVGFGLCIHDRITYCRHENLFPIFYIPVTSFILSVAGIVLFFVKLPDVTSAIGILAFLDQIPLDYEAAEDVSYSKISSVDTKVIGEILWPELRSEIRTDYKRKHLIKLVLIDCIPIPIGLIVSAVFHLPILPCIGLFFCIHNIFSVIRIVRIKNSLAF